MAGIADIAAGVRCALEPIDNALTNETMLAEFFADLGWEVRASPGAMGAIRTAFAIGPAFDAALAVAQQLETGGSTPSPALANSLREALVGLIDAFKALSQAPPTGGLPAPLNSAAFWQEIGVALADSLLLKHVERAQPIAFALLRMSGLAEITVETPRGAGRMPYERWNIRWDRLPRVIGEPDRLIREVWGWGGASFNHALLDEILGQTLRALRIPARTTPPTAPQRARWYADDNPALRDVRTLAVPLIAQSSVDRSVYAELGLALTPIPPRGQPRAAPAGFALMPLANGRLTGGSGSSDALVRLLVRGGFDLDAVLGAEIRPSGVELFADVGRASLDAEVRVAARPPRPFILVGDPGGFRLEAGGAEIGVGVRGQLADPELTVRLGTGTPEGGQTPKLAIVIQTSEADGFLGKLIGTNPLRFELGGAVVWSSRSGLHFEGSGGFEWTIPLNLNLGPAEISTLTLALGAGSGGVEIGAGVTGRAMLGPLTAVVEQFGLAVTLRFGDARGDLGPLNVALGFKPPKGIGLAIDAGVVKGGGYLFFDNERGEYAGALELTFASFLSLKAIGLLNTRMPDGSRGFSLLIIITAEFGSGIQLGFGFTLIGVGGLLGLNRTMRLQPLMEGVRTGAINSVMFPRDVIANAPKIISDLRTLFPPENGKFLIGPMAKLGWGTPTLVSLALGIIIEIPGNLAIIGVLRIALPADQVAVVVIQVNFAGAIEFDKKRVYFFASLFDSRVLFLTIEGEIAVVAQFGDDATFVLSVGGFHPRFDPPPLPVPIPRRIAVNIINTAVARVRVEGYFAVTSNTVQFGARAELFFGFSALNVQGSIGFDALFQFSPFHFVIEVSASFSVKVFGIGLFSISVRMSLEGPTPWRARGTGSISILFFDIDVDFDVTWGEARDTQLEPVDVLPLLAAELQKAEGWKALPPAPSNLLVSLRRLDPGRAAEDLLVLHPLGALQVTQRAVPLDLTIDKVGNRKAADAKRFSVAAGRGLAKRADVSEQFAPAQYRDMADAEKLGKPAFEREHGGIELTPAGQEIASGALVKRVNRYELSTIDTAFQRRRIRFHAFPSTLFVHFLAGCAIARSPLSQAIKDQHDPFAPADKIAVGDEGWTVASQQDNSAVGTAFASEAQAQDALAAHLAANPGAAVHVIPAFEVAA
ncbi:DUF6603 domain-containing protein [Conexibacter stalactiti]|uniref:DUF6603 domain-containing protein n=1 Tax=Conexibacter stalactiti TaxID=1940611 RepID=A0ABU4HHA1_9ACTN|nr:DUF6603 domain-containing protein [Conexibacter stalactiti]MDW5592697.1 DUF6603 domain-containing protein [Conexibacter stalactiti]MEC5033338.1 DUF6603 domain-containing protein [Conexibacter stalactiti]